MGIQINEISILKNNSNSTKTPKIINIILFWRMHFTALCLLVVGVTLQILPSAMGCPFDCTYETDPTTYYCITTESCFVECCEWVESLTGGGGGGGVNGSHSHTNRDSIFAFLFPQIKVVVFTIHTDCYFINIIIWIIRNYACIIPIDFRKKCDISIKQIFIYLAVGYVQCCIVWVHYYLLYISWCLLRIVG